VRDQIDDLFVGQVTRPEMLAGLCDGIDVVFSSVGLTRQKDGLTFHDVDYQGNKNILDRALEASVAKFLYVSVYNAQLMEHLAIVKAHEDFVRALQASGLPRTIMRPTGYFSDIGEYFQMAKSGRAYLIGDGKKCLNPIHGADLANVCADALTGGDAEVPAGGPMVYSQNEIAELAFSVLGKPPRINHIPARLARAGIGAMRLFDRHAAELFDFFATAGRYENVAPALARTRWMSISGRSVDQPVDLGERGRRKCMPICSKCWPVHCVTANWRGRYRKIQESALGRPMRAARSVRWSIRCARESGCF
jgi:uncharacterized protein YbjT (DUF2867 family)